MKNRKNMAISLVLACFVTVLAVVLWMSQSTQSLQAKDKPEPQSVNNMTRGFARSLDFYLQKQGTTTGINGVKIELEVQKNGVWEKATGADGKILEFVTKETGRVQLVELVLRDLETKYGTAAKYRFYEASQPDGDYVPSIGATSEEFAIPTEQTGHFKVILYNRLIGYYTFTVRESVTSQPLKGVTLALQVNQGGWNTIGSNENYPAIDGVPTEFTTNSLGQVTLTPDLLAKLVNYRGVASFQVRLMVSAVPDGYFVPPMGNQYFTLGGTGTVSPAAESIVVYPNRAVTFQKTDGMTGKPLAGVAFELQNRRTATGEFVKVEDAPGLTLPSLVTDSKGEIHFDETVIAALRAAFPTDATEYRFKEITAPAGYRPVTDESASNSFKITPLLVTPKKVSMINMPLENELTLEKRDGITGVLLSGATFVIQKQAGDDAWNDIAGTKTTNANGRIVLQSSDLAALGDGVYRFKETVAPAGYEAPTDESVSDSFEITGGEYVSKSFLTMRNDPLVKGEPYIRLITMSTKYKNTLDTRTGKGYVDEYEASQGWIRSNDELKIGYTISPEEGKSRSLKDLKIRVTAEVLDGKGYSDFADKSKEPLQNAMFTLNTPINEIENGFTYDSTTRTVKAWQKFVIKEVQGDFVDFSIDIKVGSTFFGTELPLRYQLEVLSATDRNTGEEIIFNQGPDKDLYHYDLPIPFPNNTLKVTSMLNMVPRTDGYNNNTTGISKTAFTTLTGSTDYPNSKVASLGYGWQTVPLETRPTGSNLGLAVAKGNNNFNMTVNQSIMATMSNGEKIPLTLGDGSNDDLPKIELFSYGAAGQPFVDPVGIYTGKYQNYNKTALPTTYKNFRNATSTGDYGYLATQNQQNGDITIKATAPTYFPFYVNPKPTVPALDPNGGFQPNVLFGVGNFLVYPAQQFTMNSTRNTRETLSATQQDYTIGLAGASYEDNEGNLVEFPGDPATNGTWTEKFPLPPVTPAEKEYSLTMEKKDKYDGFLLTGGKFVLEYKPKGGTTWTEVTLSGFTNLSANENGQIVFTQAQLEQLVAEVGKGSYRFREIEAPEGYREPENYANQDDLNSQAFDLDGDTISKTRVQIDNEPKDLGLIFRKQGKDQDGKTVDLDGAIFDLYIGRPNVPNPSKDEDYTWEKVDVQKVFNLTEAEAITKFTSSNSGQIPLTAADLTALVNYTGGNPSYGPGRYRFKEVQPPPGYALPEGDKAFSQSFQLLADDVVPKGITMMNERIAEWKTIEKNSIGSAYGYSVDDAGKDKFAPLGTSYKVPATIENLVKAAGPYSKLATNYGVALQGEEIVVGSYQEAQYYSYATDNEQYIENWQPTSAEMIQLWNPQEGEFVGASYNYFENMSDIGKTEPLKYGVKKDGDYTNGALDAATKDSYDWYDAPSSVPSGKEISAVYGKITNFKKNYRTGSNVHAEVIPTRWNLYTKRRATGTPGNGPDGKKPNPIKGNNYYTTYTRAQITYKNYKTDVPPEDKEKTITYSNTPYKPTGYAATTGAYAPNPASSFADTLLIIPYYQPTIKKEAYNVETKEKADTFSLNSMMEFGLEVTFPKPRPGTVTGSGFEFTLRDYTNYNGLKDKDNFTYRQNSSYLNSLPMDNPEYITNGNNRYLEWKNIQGSYDVSNVYDLRFNAYPLETGKFTNYVVLDTWYGPLNANKPITITDAQNSGGIHKTTTTPVIERAGPNSHSPIDYTINLQNYVPDKIIRAVKVLDVLPSSGDDRGSDFEGGFSLEQFTATKMDGSTLDDDPETKFYYTTVALPEDLSANDAFEYAGANWKEFKNITETDKKQVKAILAMLPDLPSGTFYNVHIELLPFGNKADDRYVNRARFGFNILNVFGQEEPIQVSSRNIETVVIDRLIEGNVWQDLTYSGIMKENEPRIENVDVNLYTMDGAGKLTKIADTMTDQNGFYQFDTLAEGYYKVGFKLPPQYEDYIVTKLNVAGGDPLLTNKVSQTLMTDDGYHLTQDSILLPFYEYEKDEEGNDTDVLKTRIEEKGWNMGILPAPNMEVKKEVQKKNSKDEYEDINHGKVNIGDELRYVITVKNTVDHSFLEDIRIQDALPRGLEYVANTLYLAHPDPTEDEQLDASRYTFAPNQNGIWELQTQPLGNFDETTKEIKIYFNVTVTGEAKGKLTNVATATGTLPPEENINKDSEEVDNHVLPDPSLEKTHSWEGMDTGVPLKKGGEFTYTITVKNAAGASSWEDVMLRDTLNELMSDDPANPVDYLEYRENSTTVDGVPVSDATSWDSSKKQLQLNLGDFTGDANGVTKIVQFKVKLVKIPPKDPDGKIWIRNAATAVGTGTDADDTEKEYDTSDLDEFPLDKLLNKAKIHVRQVVLDANEKLVVPTLGYLTMTQSDATNQPLTGSSSGLNINSIDQNKWGNKTLQEVKDSFTTFSLALLPDQKVTQFDLTIPEYYKYLGAGWTTELTESDLTTTHTTAPKDPKDPNDPTVLRLALKDDEYWITLFIKPSDKGENPRPYSWDYKVNDFGKLKEPEFTVSAFPEDKIINSIPYWIYEVKNTGKDTIEDLVITGNLLTGPQGTTTYVPTNPSLISYDGGESIEELPGDINIDFNDKNTQAVITLPPTQTLEQNQTITIYLPFKAPGGGEFKSTATATGTRNGETIKATLVESPKRE